MKECVYSNLPKPVDEKANMSFQGAWFKKKLELKNYQNPQCKNFKYHGRVTYSLK